MSPRWAAVVVAYESGPLLTDCVGALLTDDSAGGPPEVVVVDNGSGDGSIERLGATHPEVAVLRPGANLGYARAANLGTAATRAPIVAVINPDALVTPGAGAAVLARFDADAHLGAVGPRILESDGSVYPSARRVPSTRDAIGHAVLGTIRPHNAATRRYRELDADPEVAREVDWVSGAAVWLRRSALDAIGGWDEGYFMYVEDVDLCWRLGRAGWTVAYEPTATVSHVQGVSTAGHPYRMVVAHHRSTLRFAGKRWHGVRRVLLAPLVVLLAVRAGLVIAVRWARPERAAAGLG
ncbi:MAG: glycosyltransferase family 2 protein [Actinomycetes bacterium]